MANQREYLVVSRDGTIIHATDCVVLHANKEQADLLEEMPDNERFNTLRLFDNAVTVDQAMYELAMNDG